VICRVDAFDPVVLIGHNPPSIFTTTKEHIDHLRRKEDGHYERADLDALVRDGHAVEYDEKALALIVRGIGGFIHGCGPVT
jgi:hypothetical protein